MMMNPDLSGLALVTGASPPSSPPPSSPPPPPNVRTSRRIAAKAAETDAAHTLTSMQYAQYDPALSSMHLLADAAVTSSMHVLADAAALTQDDVHAARVFHFLLM